jgi:type VI secretion system secreted protein Hcp
MATDYFLKFSNNIKGETAKDGHADEIEILSWSWGESNSGSAAAGGGQGSGIVNMQDFSFSMMINKASPTLLKMCASGEHIEEAVLTCRRAGKVQQPYLTVKFTDCLVSSFQTGGSQGAEIPVDSVGLNFSKIEYSYSPQKKDGTLGTAIPVGYDLKTGKTC